MKRTSRDQGREGWGLVPVEPRGTTGPLSAFPAHLGVFGGPGVSRIISANLRASVIHIKQHTFVLPREKTTKNNKNENGLREHFPGLPGARRGHGWVRGFGLLLSGPFSSRKATF